MRLDAIRTFLAVVEAGSYASAAESQYSSTTTLHGHVKSIQDELGATLFTFSGRRLELSAAGHEFLLFAERFVIDYDAMHRAIGGRVKARARPLRIKSAFGPSVHLLPQVAREWSARHPDIPVSIETGQKGESLAALSARQIDIAVMNDAGISSVDDALVRTPIYSDRLVAAVRADCYQAPDVELVQSLAVAAQPPGHPTREYLERWAKAQGLDFSVAYEHAAFDGIDSHIRAGVGVGFLGEYVVRRSVDEGELVLLDLPGFGLQRTITALHHRDADDRTVALVRLMARTIAAAQAPALAEAVSA